MKLESGSYFAATEPASTTLNANRHQQALQRCIVKLRDTMPIIGVRNPKIGTKNNHWTYCRPYDWVVSFHAGQLWLAYQLTFDPVFLNAARARRPVFRAILDHQRAQDHDLGFQFSLSCVAEWLMTCEPESHAMALEAARLLLNRYRPEGRYIQAWNALPPHGGMDAELANGRIIADTMQNLALLYWAFAETGRVDFRDAANGHAETTLNKLVRSDDTSFHTFRFDPMSGKPVGGETHQGYADDSCWSRGQAWLIHGFAQSAAVTGSQTYLDAACRLAAKAEELMGSDTVPAWDYNAPKDKPVSRDSSAGAVMAAGLYMLAQQSTVDAARWRDFGDRLIAGLLDSCDLTADPQALGLLAHGAAHVGSGYSDTMLPYGDYYFMEALMRSLGHTQFFW
ncbi:glycoside hydrolase family 88 protein [Phyllobacterium myrsinacearum]|uniref:Unsaturated chondroitin disaccharide hydrolase n=1 Tax=Phyllobacterium myrsinacearum TaxID=28101 RepID=A0A839EU24_9HYPH|nr:glycoside hydrolase family 88 protein [Phyllobacterium myrsinacearum]MBA8880994.1 unsaturated chondroitin disaccharide hydrolase [Phyllobacterium myrsinacearum]